jgi:hypothetical protein
VAKVDHCHRAGGRDKRHHRDAGRGEGEFRAAWQKSKVGGSCNKASTNQCLRSGPVSGRGASSTNANRNRGTTKGAAWRSSGNDFLAAPAATRGLSAR